MSVCLASWSAASATCWLKSAWIRRVVRTPTTVANPNRITSVSAAEPPARRQRIGRRLYAGDVARAADRMEDSRVPPGLGLPYQVGDEHLAGVGHRERVVAPGPHPDLLGRDDQPLVAHQVLEQLELALREVDRPVTAGGLVGVGVEHQVADPQRSHAARRAAPQEGSEAREQLLALERLDQVVVGADV